jgi:hypothetical protein
MGGFMSNRMACRWSICAILAVLVPQIVPTISAAQVLRAPPKSAHSRTARSNGHALAPVGRGQLDMTTVNESEPNDSIPAADPIALGDAVAGLVSPEFDVDYFGIDLAAGTTLVLDVDAAQYGSSLDPILGLFDRDSLTMLAFSDDWDGLDSHIEFTIPVTGRYFVGIMDFSAGGGAGYFYSLTVRDFARPEAPLADVANAFLGVSGAISADMERYLDQQGNDNGRLDVADFRMYLLSIRASAAPAGRVKP